MNQSSYKAKLVVSVTNALPQHSSNLTQKIIWFQIYRTKNLLGYMPEYES